MLQNLAMSTNWIVAAQLSSISNLAVLLVQQFADLFTQNKPPVIRIRKVAIWMVVPASMQSQSNTCKLLLHTGKAKLHARYFVKY